VKPAHDITAILINGRPPLFLCGYAPREARALVESTWRLRPDEQHNELFVYYDRSDAHYAKPEHGLHVIINPDRVDFYAHENVGA
jgi:hypothetical protein